MRKVLVTLALALGVATATTRPAEADGPFCFTMLPFANFLVVFVEGSGGNQFVGSGRDLASGATVQVSGYVTGGNTHLAFSASPDSVTGFPLLAGATMGGRSQTGPGICHRVNSGEGCGTGTAITLSFVPCPPDAATDAPADSRAARGKLG